MPKISVRDEEGRGALKTLEETQDNEYRSWKADLLREAKHSTLCFGQKKNGLFKELGRGWTRCLWASNEPTIISYVKKKDLKQIL